MYELAEIILPSHIITTLAEHHIEVTIQSDADDFNNPRNDENSSVWVNVDVPTQLNIVDEGHCFEDYVSNYCKDILNCSVNDIIWATVYKYEHSGVCYSLSPFSCPWDSGIDGFIYETKDNVRKEFGNKRVTSKLERKIKDRLRSEVACYNKWVNGEVYYINLKDTNGNIEFIGLGGITTDDASEKEVFCEAINEILAESDVDLVVSLEPSTDIA